VPKEARRRLGKTDVEYRAIYVAKCAEGIYVLHVFDKRARRTPLRDIQIARSRFHELQAQRAKSRR